MTSSRRVLVTGAGGALGGHVARRLSADGDRVFAMVRPGHHPAIPLPREVETVEGDLGDGEAVKQAIAVSRPDDIVHCAGLRARASLHDLLASNVMSLANLLDAVDRAAPARFLVVGSSAEYAEATDGRAIAEDQLLDPVTPYGLSKLFQYRLSQLAGRDSVPIVYARPFNLVGPGVSPETALGDFARKVAALMRDANDAVIDTGNLDLERDFTDVRDGANACIALLRRGTPGLAYNVCSGVATRLGDALAVLLRLAGRPIEVRSHPAPYGMRQQRGDATRLRALGWQPGIDLATSLSDALHYWLEREAACPQL